MLQFSRAFSCFQLQRSVDRFDAVFSILTKLSSNNVAIHVLGEFPAYWKDLWASVVKYRPSFGTRPHRACFDKDGDIKRLIVLEDPSNQYYIFDINGKVSITVKFHCDGIPNFTPFHLLQWIVADILQSYNMLRGGKEPSLLTRHDFEFGKMQDGEFKGRPYVRLKSSHQGQKKKGALTISNNTRYVLFPWFNCNVPFDLN